MAVPTTALNALIKDNLLNFCYIFAMSIVREIRIDSILHRFTVTICIKDIAILLKKKKYTIKTLCYRIA